MPPSRRAPSTPPSRPDRSLPYRLRTARKDSWDATEAAGGPPPYEPGGRYGSRAVPGGATTASDPHRGPAISGLFSASSGWSGAAPRTGVAGRTGRPRPDREAGAAVSGVGPLSSGGSADLSTETLRRPRRGGRAGSEPRDGLGAFRELTLHSSAPASLQRPPLRSGRDGQRDSYYSSVAYSQVGALLAPCARGAGTLSVRAPYSPAGPNGTGRPEGDGRDPGRVPGPSGSGRRVPPLREFRRPFP
jgi:hypothetical protein